ncbi:MAG: hypothetical protein ACRC5C_13840 [Bacilli bacterium]
MSNTLCGCTVAPVTFPQNPKYFNELTITSVLNIDCTKREIASLLCVNVNVETKSLTKVCTTPGISNEGQIVYNEAIVAEIAIYRTIKYIAAGTQQSVCYIELPAETQFVTIIVPPDVCLDQLLYKNKVRVTSYVEDNYAVKIDGCSVYNSLSLFVNAEILD